MNYELKIRRATKNDASIIAKVVAMAIGEEIAVLYCGENYDVVLKELACMEVSQYSYKNVFVAEVDGEIAGAAVAYDGADLYRLREATLKVISRHVGKEVVMKDDETDASEFYLDSLGVLPKYRGNGVGAKLIQAVCDRAAELGKPAGLLVDFENPDAERLYKSLGFERVEEKDFLGCKMWHLQLI